MDDANCQEALQDRDGVLLLPRAPPVSGLWRWHVRLLRLFFEESQDHMWHVGRIGAELRRGVAAVMFEQRADDVVRCGGGQYFRLFGG